MRGTGLLESKRCLVNQVGAILSWQKYQSRHPTGGSLQ